MTASTRRSSAVLAVVLASASVASGQQTPQRPLAEGDSVRARSGPIEATGVLLSAGERLRIQTDRGITVLRLTDDSRVERYQGTRSTWAGAGRGALIMGGGGAVLGALVGAVTVDGANESIVVSPGEGAIIGAAFGLVLGGAIGGLIGALSPGERWERIDVQTLRVSVGPWVADPAVVAVSITLPAP